jgi:hypothetical protein
MFEGLRELLHGYLTAWLVKTENRDPADARERAIPLTRQVMALYQAELLRIGLRDKDNTDENEETAS